MGTHPIFESDFDCLTDCRDWKMHQRRWNEANGFTVAEIKAKLAEWREVFPVNQPSQSSCRKRRKSGLLHGVRGAFGENGVAAARAQVQRGRPERHDKTGPV